MSYQINTAQERKELISLMANIFGVNRKKFSKRKNDQLLNKLKKAHLHPEQIKEDVIEEAGTLHTAENKSNYETNLANLIDNYIRVSIAWTRMKKEEMDGEKLAQLQEAKQVESVNNVEFVNVAGGAEGKEKPFEFLPEPQEILPEPENNQELTIKDSAQQVESPQTKQKPGKIIRWMVSQGNFTWDEIVDKAVNSFGIKQSTVQQYKSDFKNLKYAPKEGVMATRGDGTVCWI